MTKAKSVLGTIAVILALVALIPSAVSAAEGPAGRAQDEDCLDATLVADVTIPDGASMAPGEAFTKVWRIRNTGTCTWKEGFEWVFIGEDRMGAPNRVSIAEPVAPGDDYDVMVDLVAPQEPGEYRSLWQVYGPEEQPIGMKCWVLIQVPGAVPTAEPSTASPADAVGPPADVANWSQAVWQHINGERDRHGLSQLAYNETLALAAQRHANDCAARGFGSHAGSDGSNVKMRVERVGFAGSVEESWALNASPQGAVDWWLDEVPPNDWHRRMLLANYYSEVGVGVAEADWGYYFIAVFGQAGR